VANIGIVLMVVQWRVGEKKCHDNCVEITETTERGG
jgi:hypothetical protein